MNKKVFFVPIVSLALLLSGCNLFNFLPNGNGSSSSESSSGGSSSIVNHDVESVSIYPGSMTLTLGQTALLTAKIAPETAIDREVSWSSSNTSKVSITADGTITALAVGSSTITARSHQFNNIKGTCTITVLESQEVDSAFKKATPKYTYYDMDHSRYVQNSGNQKVLVIPTYFKGDSGKATEANRQFIEMSFFGENADCGWRSFTGYYKQASFGKLNYSGHVAGQWYQATYTKQQVLDNQYASQYIAAAALVWFQTQYPSFDLSDYDANNDGYIDSLYIIYSAEYVIENDETTNLWGYRWSVFVDASQTKPYKANPFSWFSLKFLKDTTTGQHYGGVPEWGSNTRIIIHEHGHMLGLNDYYDTSYSGMDLVGSWDMQSNNVFDWNAFSKYSMGWVQPYYVDQDVLQSKGSASITIKPSSLNGDCIVVRDKTWNGSPFDEYLMIELFNPEVGNNEYDYHYSSYSELTKNTGYGVKIYHVDARMYNTYTHSATDTISRNDGAIVVPLDNTNKEDNSHNYSGPSSWDNYYLLHLLQRQNTNTFGQASKSARSTWRSADLWKTGHTFSLGSHTGYTNYGPNFFYNQVTFDDGTTLPYGITFTNVSADSATITFTYLG